MAALYLLAGVMREIAGSFLLTELGGIYRNSPFLTCIAFLIFFAAAGLPPGSGLWPKVMLAKASIGAGEGWLAGAILVSGFLTTIALGRVFLLAFWRDGETGPGTAMTSVQRLAIYAPLIALAVPMVVLGIFPERFISIADLAATGLIDSAVYIRSVFPSGGN